MQSLRYASIKEHTFCFATTSYALFLKVSGFVLIMTRKIKNNYNVIKIDQKRIWMICFCIYWMRRSYTDDVWYFTWSNTLTAQRNGLFHLTATDPTDYSTLLPRITLIVPLYCHGSHWLFHLTAKDPTDYSTLLPRIPLSIPPHCHGSHRIFHLTSTDSTDYSSSLPRIPPRIPPHCHRSHWLFHLTVTDSTDYSTSLQQISPILPH